MNNIKTNNSAETKINKKGENNMDNIVNFELLENRPYNVEAVGEVLRQLHLKYGKDIPKAILNNVFYNIAYEDGMQISVSEGNIKIGKIRNFNMLPGDTPIMVRDHALTNVVGTCDGVCEGCKNNCYAINDTRRHHNACVPAQAKNTVIMRHSLDDLFEQLAEYVEKDRTKIFRFHSAGEIPSYEYLVKMAELATKFPETIFYVYTKRFNFVQRYLEEHKSFPSNLTVNISEWHHNTDGYNFDSLNKFVYDDGTDPEVSALPHCPAVKKGGAHTGVLCDKCGLCYRQNNGHRIAVYAH